MMTTMRDLIQKSGSTSRGRWSASIALLLLMMSAEALAHGVSPGDKALIQGGQQLVVFIYLGAKHMVTGYDHLLFLFGVIFFLYRLKDVGEFTSYWKEDQQASGHGAFEEGAAFAALVISQASLVAHDMVTQGKALTVAKARLEVTAPNKATKKGRNSGVRDRREHQGQAWRQHGVVGRCQDQKG